MVIKIKGIFKQYEISHKVASIEMIDEYTKDYEKDLDLSEGFDYINPEYNRHNNSNIIIIYVDHIYPNILDSVKDKFGEVISDRLESFLKTLNREERLNELI